MAVTINGTTGVTIPTGVFGDASGNVGIGTTSPGTQFNVYKSTATAVNIRPQNSLAYADFGPQADGSVYGPFATPAASTQLVVGTSNSNPFTFYTNSAERMRIDSSGNVGIGTSSPGNKLVTASNAANSKIEIQNTSTAASTSKTSALQFTGTDTSGTLKDSGDIFVTPADNNYVGSNMLFYTRGSDTTAERMRIDSSGNLLVGYTSSNGAYKLQVNSQIFATSATIATSDGRYKKDIQSLDGALGLVNQLNPVQFSWKQHPVHAFDTSTPTIGFIAQEIQQVLADKPYLSSIIKSNKCVIKPEEKDDDGNMIKEAVTEEFLGIAEGNMIALLTKAIQEQQALIQTLTARITALEAR